MSNPQLDAQYEIFAKGIYSYFGNNGQLQQLIAAFLDTQGYAIDRVFDDPNTSLQALGLR